MAGLILILVGMFRPLAGGKRRLPERGSAMYISYFESGRNTSETCRSSAVTCCVKTGGGVDGIEWYHTYISGHGHIGFV